MARKITSETGFSFKSEEDFEKWLSDNYDRSSGIWVRMYKSNARIKAIDSPKLIDVLLCYGWITGPARKGNEIYVLWWVCPRKKNRKWSKLNKEHAERLIREKRMKPSGIAEVRKAQTDGKWH